MKEIWKDVVGYESRYKVSNFGNIKSFITNGSNGGYILKAFDRGNGYLAVNLYYSKGKFKTISVHQIVAHAFLGEPPKNYQVNHIDMNRYNNRLDNLEYLSSLDNQMHSRKFKHWTNGLRGENHPRAKLTRNQVLEIRKVYKEGSITRKELANHYNVKLHVIVDIVLNRTWKHLL